MRRRFLLSTLLVTFTGVIVFGVPLGVSFSHLRRNEALTDRDRVAERAAFLIEQTRFASPRTVKVSFGSMTSGGYRVEARFPNGRTFVAGPTLRHISWSAPVVTDHGAVVRVGIDANIPRNRARDAWLFVGFLAVIGTAVSLLVAQISASRLARPLHAIANTSRVLGSGDFSVRAGATGIGELDEIIDALNGSAARIDELVAIERDFSAAASHQLRTPLTSLRLRLEDLTDRELPNGARQSVEAALATSDRLAATIDELLAFRRSGKTGHETDIDVATLVTDHVRLFEPRFAVADRRIELVIAPTHIIRGTPGAIGQALDVLLDNGLRHGAGTVTVAVSPTQAGARIAVSDEGAGVLPSNEGHIFDRDANRGLGLPLARALIESDGGRLQLVRPAAFEILLSTAP